MRDVRVLIVGCGYVGSALGLRLANMGAVVWGMRRERGRLPTAIHHVEGDLVVPNTLRNLPSVDYVIYLAGPAGDDDASYQAIYGDGLRYLMSALVHGQQKLRRFFLASCVSVYGDRGGDWVDEESALSAQKGPIQHLCEAERIVTEARMRTTVVRLGELYGPDRMGPLRAVLDGQTSLHNPRSHTNLLHRDDAVGAIAHLMEKKKRDDLYVVTDREPTPRLSVMAWLASQLDRPMPTITEKKRGAATDVRCMSERLAETNYRFRYPSFREGFASALSRLV